MTRAALNALAILLCGMTSAQTVNAQPADVNRLTKATLSSGLDALEIQLRAQAPLEATQVTIYAEGKRVHLDVIGATTKLKRLKARGEVPEVKRTRLKALKGARPLARVTLRMKRGLDAALLEEAMVLEEAGGLSISIPKSEAIAKRWARMRKTQTLDALEARLQATEARPKRAVAPKPPTQHVNATAPLAPPKPKMDLPEAEQPLELGAPITLDEAEAPLTAGVAEPTEAIGKVAVFLAFFMLMAVGFLFWRKIQPQSLGGGERLIRQVGRHAIGPKQNLVLLDVVGQMVLVGTSDKGVQMLTKIDQTPAPEALPQPRRAAPAPKIRREVVPTEAPLPDDALEDAPRVGFAESLGRAFAKVRDVATSKPSVDDGDDHLAALCDAVADKAPTPATAPPDLLKRLREQSLRG